MKKFLIVTLLCSPMAALGAGYLEADFLKGDFDATVTGFGSGSVDTDGLALRAEFGEPGSLGFAFEYNKITPDGSSEDLNDMRLGIILSSKDQALFGKAELINLDSGGGSETGYGVHIGARSAPGQGLGGLVSIGYADVDDGNGIEFDLEGNYTFGSNWSGVVNYRSNNYEFDGGELTIAHVRAGVRYNFN